MWKRRQEVRYGLKDQLRQALGDGIPQLLPGFRINGRASETFSFCRRGWPLRIAVPNIVGAAVQTRTQRSPLGQEQFCYSRPSPDKGRFGSWMQAPTVDGTESWTSVIHI